MGSAWDERDDSSLNGLEFEWHPLKAAANVKKHAVSFDEAKTIFGDKKHLVFPDRLHSDEEERYLAFGRSDQDRLIALCFTERGLKLRLISARLMEPWERREYEIANE
ncbi:MAG: BrnT family toxin [Terracidiphilus sp.]|nr:BrnT family toxin [Terracidiphilus sp.]